MRFAIELLPDDNGTFLALALDLPEVTSFGATREEALVHVLDAIETALQGRIADRLPIPVPAKIDRSGAAFVVLPALSALKLELYREMLDRGLRKADLARLLEWKPPQVDRLLELGHASRLDQIEAAFAVLDRAVAFSIHPAPTGSRAA